MQAAGNCKVRSIVSVFMEVIEEVDCCGGLGLHVGVAALVEVHLFTSEVTFRCHGKRLPIETIGLAVRPVENVFSSRNAIKSVSAAFFFF